MILFVGVFALARFFVAAAAMDTGSPFEGMGAARDVTFAALAEPALFFGLLALTRMSGALSLTGMLDLGASAAWRRASAALVLILASWFIVLLAENARVPFDDPNTHLELTMIHEVMVLDHAGPAFGFIVYGAALKLAVFATLIVTLVVPSRSGSAALDVAAFAGGLVAVSVVVGLVESSMARLQARPRAAASRHGDPPRGIRRRPGPEVDDARSRFLHPHPRRHDELPRSRVLEPEGVHPRGGPPGRSSSACSRSSSRRSRRPVSWAS